MSDKFDTLFVEYITKPYDSSMFWKLDGFLTCMVEYGIINVDEFRFLMRAVLYHGR